MSVHLRPRRTPLLIGLAVIIAMVVTLVVGCGKKESTKKDGGEKGADEEVELAWPTEYLNNRRTGRCSRNGPSAAEVKWIYEAGASTFHWGVLGKDGNVIAGFEGKVVSVDATDGTLAWEFPTGDDMATTACVGEDGTIYVSAGSNVYALKSDGTRKWSYQMTSEADEPALGSDGTVYVGSVAGELVALTEEGELKWQADVQGNIRSPSIDEDGNLYCSASTLALYAFDENGKQLWDFKPEGDLPLYEEIYDWGNTLDTPSIGKDGTIYVGSFTSPGITGTGQQIADYAVPQQGKVYAVTPDGQKKWEFLHPQGKWSIHTPSIGEDGTLYCGTSIWVVVALNPDGTMLWEFNTGEGQDVCPSIFSPSIGKDGLLYAATTSGKIFCITPEGTEKWRFAADNAWLPDRSRSNNFTPPPIGEDGTLYSVLAEGKIYAFRAPGGE